MRNFRQMVIWNQAIDLATLGYKIACSFPKEEMYGIRSQFTRALVSISSNIAEGCSRTSELDFARFLEISLGSCYEVETQLVVARRVGFLDAGTPEDFVRILRLQQKQTMALLKMIRNKTGIR